MQRGGNAFPNQASRTDGANIRHTVVLSYDLQDNRLGRAEYYRHPANEPQPTTPIEEIEVWVPQGLLKPDDVDIDPHGTTLRVSISAHATWFGMGNQAESVYVSDEEYDALVLAATQAGSRGEAIQEVQPRIIALADYEFPGVWTPVQSPAPLPVVEDPTPCVLPGNLPYFKPNKQVTRAQLAKIVVLAAGIPHPATGQQTFQDVPVGSTFHEFIEALYGKGAVNGYPCTP